MTNDKNKQQSRLLTDAEFAACIKLFRETRKWSQEQLAEISTLSVRTIQRVERGLPASFETRRALGNAFEFEDIDAFNKPFMVLTEEERQAAQEKFDREHVTLSATPLTTGKQLAKLAETCTADISEPGFELSREADETFATLKDYFRDYRDCADAYAETQKFNVYDDLQAHIDSLKAMGVSLRYAERKMLMKGATPESKPLPINVLYVVAFPIGKEPEQFATTKSFGA